jgi:hypothetical protein
MPNSVEITSNNFSGEQVNIVFTPNGSDISYGLGTQTIPFLFDTKTINNELDIYGKYSIDIIDSKCTYILVI